jgi:hypothetical protein
MRISNGLQMKLFCSKPKGSKITDMITKGSQKLDEELDMVSIVKKLRHLDVIMQNSMLKDDKRKRYVEHAH